MHFNQKLRPIIKLIVVSIVIYILGILPMVAQGYLRASGDIIVDGKNENFLFRGIGTGNWMIHEGYMMQTSSFAGSHFALKDKIVSTVGEVKADSFYNVWLDNHVTKADIDSMKLWGFNTVRAVLHYKWFTLPIEEEPIQGEQTWKEKGFNLIDSLLSWCTDNEMYLVLDMHGTPGGQGLNSGISDYDPSKPSLWESDDNKQKLLALWYKLAHRYANEPYIGGYDLINETNWDFENSGNEKGCNCNQNTPLREMFEALIDTIRQTDANHIVFIEGNCYAGNYNGLESLASYDSNIVFSFHKYWNFNDQSSIEKFLDMRDDYNVPLWVGESGENSNTWFTNAIHLLESNNIGWSWWPIKNADPSNVFQSELNQDYLTLIDDWNNNTTNLTVDEAFAALLKLAYNQKAQNCKVQYDVIDAMMRQPYTLETKAFNIVAVYDTIYFTDYNFGRNNYAYFDADTGNYRVSIDEDIDWNKGNKYRNDGVDIQECTDTLTNGYNVGWTNEGEWMKYTIYSDSIAAYTLNIRYASGNGGAILNLLQNGVSLIAPLELPSNNGWQAWETIKVTDVILPAGDIELVYKFSKGGANFNYYSFDNPKTVSEVDFQALTGETGTESSNILLHLNKAIINIESAFQNSDFQVYVNDYEVDIVGVEISNVNDKILEILLDAKVYYDSEIKVSYTGTSILGTEQSLLSFTELAIQNNLPTRHILPGKIQAEDFFNMEGLELEACSDVGGGMNTGYASTSDYLEYLVHVTESGTFDLNCRIATTSTNAQLELLIAEDSIFESLNTIIFESTGGWQNWETQSSSIFLDKGYYTLRLLVKAKAQNLNWFQVVEPSPIDINYHNGLWKLYPNPAKTHINLQTNSNTVFDYELFDSFGRCTMKKKNVQNGFKIDISYLVKGIYIVRISGNGNSEFFRFVKI